MPETSEILQGRLLALLEATTLPEYTLPSAVQLNAERELVVQTHSNLRNSVETHARLRVLNVHYALADACLVRGSTTRGLTLKFPGIEKRQRPSRGAMEDRSPHHRN